MPARKQVVAYLLDSGASARECDRHGLTVLHHATMCGARGVVTFLVKEKVRRPGKRCEAL